MSGRLVIGYHLIWTAYGHWLPNDPRGSGSVIALDPRIAALGEFVYGIPELHRAELRTARYASGAGCLATATILGLWPLFKAGGVQADPVIDLHEPVLRQPQAPAVLGVALVGEGDDGVDAVVAAVELDHDQHPAVTGWAGGAGRLRQEGGHGRGQGEQGGAFQEVAAGRHGSSPRNGPRGCATRTACADQRG